MSTVHARIFDTNGTYFIEDLASRNGSTLNGQAIVVTTALVPGDVLQFGGTTMEFS
jgi:pSer/pThr/pTyr-binding forkhead associated (FHA) protein